MLELKNVTKAYNKGSVKAVDSLSMTVNDGEIFGFLGPNGAGKTTSIRMLTGILQPDEGELLLDGISIKERPIAAKRTFAFVPDNPETFSRLKAIEYLDFISDVYKIPQEEKMDRIKTYCEKFGMMENLSSRIASFSHGMKQKLFLIASLITDPKNWILDEPMVGLDPEAAFTIKEIMRERAAAGKTIFFSTHVMEVAEKLCDRIGIIKKGKLVFVGTMAELQAQHGEAGQSLEDIFLKLVAED
jgi:ABC-2 type transport system ATP-binding protein